MNDPAGSAASRLPDTPTLAAAVLLVTALSLGLHEVAHVWVGGLVGGEPSLLTSVGVEGDWSGLSARGFTVLGLSGPLVGIALALAGWLFFRTRVGVPDTIALVAWLFFAVNAWEAALYLAASPALGFGDWMMALRDLPNAGLMRASASVTGLFVAGQLVKGTGRTLAQLAGNGPARVRRERARRIVWAAWGVGGLLAVLAALLNPQSALRAAAIAAGSTFGATWPLLLVARRTAENPVPGEALRVERSWPLITVGVVAGLAYVAVLGAGLEL